MFLVDQELTLSDFLKALGFIAPKDYNVSYILTPNTISDSASNQIEQFGFQPPVEDTNIKYYKKDPENSHSFSNDNIDIMSNTLEPMPIENNEEKPEEFKKIIYNGTKVVSPYRALKVAESSNDGFTLELKESIAGLPKHTMISFKKNHKKKIKEAISIESHLPVSVNDFNNIANQITKICNQIESATEDLKQANKFFLDASNRYNKSYNVKNSLILRYKNDKIGNGTGLPGVISNALGSYNIASVKEDSENMKKALSDFKQAEYQKELYLNNMKRAYLSLQNYMKALIASDNNMDMWMQQVVHDADWID